jgi:hypothetical protein
MAEIPVFFPFNFSSSTTRPASLTVMISLDRSLLGVRVGDVERREGKGMGTGWVCNGCGERDMVEREGRRNKGEGKKGRKEKKRGRGVGAGLLGECVKKKGGKRGRRRKRKGRRKRPVREGGRERGKERKRMR